jgi:hypothetical protein
LLKQLYELVFVDVLRQVSNPQLIDAGILWTNPSVTTARNGITSDRWIIF